MSGAQPKAAYIAGVVSVIAEVNTKLSGQGMNRGGSMRYFQIEQSCKRVREVIISKQLFP